MYCQIVRSELQPEVILATIIDPERCKLPQNAYKWAGIALLTSPTGSEIIFCQLQGQITQPEVEI